MRFWNGEGMGLLVFLHGPPGTPYKELDGLLVILMKLQRFGLYFRWIRILFRCMSI